MADILIAVRSRTHAVIDLPPGANAERVAAQLGPAPAREVLTSLLSGSNFNYVILASDTDEDAIQSVLLTPRGRADDGVTGTVTGTVPGSVRGVRRMPGYSDLSHVTGSATQAQGDGASEDVSSEPSSGLGAATPGPQPGLEATAPVPEGTQASVDGAQQAAASDAVPADRAAPAGITSPASTGAGASQPPTADANQPPSSTPQMVQDLQRMYQQRRQIQVQQNQTPPPPPN